MRHVRIVLAALALCCVASAPQAAEKSVLTVGIGQYDIIPNDNKSVAMHVQYRFADGFGGAKMLGGKFLGFKPLVGAFINTDKAAFGFAGFAMPFSWGKGAFEFEPSAGIGAFHKGDSQSLGGTFQFHLGLQFSARVTKSLRAGVGLTHVSNAGLHNKNPGTNILMGTIGWMF